jgi:hypothetical protein
VMALVIIPLPCGKHRCIWIPSALQARYPLTLGETQSAIRHSIKDNLPQVRAPGREQWNRTSAQKISGEQSDVAKDGFGVIT